MRQTTTRQRVKGQLVVPVYRRPSKRGGAGRRRELLVSCILRAPPPGSFGRERLVPYIRMSGVWLEHLGFKYGERIEVTAEPGRLVLTIVRDEGALSVN
jgi:hypothetical protein